MVRNVECALHTEPSSTVLASLLMLGFLVRMAVVEQHTSCQYHENPGGAPFLLNDVLVVTPVITSLKCSSHALRGEISHQYPLRQLPYFDIHDFLLLHWYN